MPLRENENNDNSFSWKESYNHHNNSKATLAIAIASYCGLVRGHTIEFDYLERRKTGEDVEIIRELGQSVSSAYNWLSRVKN